MSLQAAKLYRSAASGMSKSFEWPARDRGPGSDWRLRRRQPTGKVKPLVSFAKTAVARREFAAFRRFSECRGLLPTKPVASTT